MENLSLHWHRYLDEFEPLRPELYRFCRHLTRSPWDADDLVQDTLARAFATLGRTPAPPDNPRAWLFRVASNLHIDRLRRERSVPLEASRAPAAEPQATREAAGTLLSQLAPQERVAVLLKEAFSFSLEEIAALLSTSTGAIKSALHRGREKLAEPEPVPARVPVPEAIDAFCKAFNAGDIAALAALLLETVQWDVVRVHTDFGRESARQGVLFGMLYGIRRLADPAQPKYPQAELFETVLDAAPRAEVRVHRGEPILVIFYPHQDGEAVRGICRFEVSDGLIGQLRNYFYTPDVIAEVCGELQLPFKPSGYRYWHLGE